MELFEQDIFANGIKLHIYRTTTGRPPLVFAHGITDNGLCFSPIAEQLADDFEIILYDSRGHGRSEAVEANSTIIDRAKDLAGLVNALELHRPGLLGHSMGALTVAIFAGLFPDVPGRIILEDPPPFDLLVSNSGDTPDTHKPWKELAAANKRKSIQELVEMSRLESPTWPEAERQPWAQAKQQLSLSIFDETYIDANLGKQIVSQIICPLLILTADVDKRALYPPQAAEKLVASLPLARHVNIPGAGHNIRREQPAAFLKAVRSFLSSS